MALRRRASSADAWQSVSFRRLALVRAWELPSDAGFFAGASSDTTFQPGTTYADSVPSPATFFAAPRIFRVSTPPFVLPLIGRDRALRHGRRRQGPAAWATP